MPADIKRISNFMSHRKEVYYNEFRYNYPVIGFIIAVLYLSCFVDAQAYLQNMEKEDIQQRGYSNAQNSGSVLNIPITLHKTNVNLKSVLETLSENYAITFVYNDSFVNIPRLTINAENLSLSAVLTKLLEPFNISFHEFLPGQITLAKSVSMEGLNEVINTGNLPSRIKQNALVGFVKNVSGETLTGAHVMLVDTEEGDAADNKGAYFFDRIKPGRHEIKVSYVGYKPVTGEINIEPNHVVIIDFQLIPASFLIGGIEVVANSDLLPDDASTKTVITSGEIEHYQASSIKDVMDLVPGVQKTTNPGLAKAGRVTLRGDVDDSFGTFGTLVILDDIPVSNNADLQFVKPSNTYMSSSTGRGIDLRSIPADNVESIEVVTGLPSVKYGDVTSGVIKVETKKGITPTRLKIKNNPDTREGNLGGGFGLGEGFLNYNFNIARSERNIRQSGDEYTRLTGQLIYTDDLFDERLNTTNKIMVQRILDEEAPQGDMLRTNNYNRGYTISLSTTGEYIPFDGRSSVSYSLFATMRRENTMESKLVTDYLITPENDTLSNYIGKVNTKGIQWTLGGRLEWNKVFSTGKVTHNILLGSNPQYDVNTGEGMMLDTVYNYYGVESGRRSYSFDDIPGQFLMNFYFEDKITSHFIRDFSLTLGFRYEMYRPYKFNLSGLWGDGNLVDSHQGTYFNPRLNLMIYLSPNNQLRFSAGTSSKSPPMSAIYPPEYVEVWRNPGDSTNKYIRLDRIVPDLKGYRETLYEAAYDQKLFNSVGMSFSAYYKIRKNEPESHSIPIFQTSGSGDEYTVYYVDTYSKYINVGQTETKGLELSIKTAKVKALNMEFKVTGSYNYIKYFSRQTVYSSTVDESIGEYDNYLVPDVAIDTLIGMTYPESEKWQDYMQFNYLIRYTHPTLGLWITLRAEHLVSERYQYTYSTPVDINLLNETQLGNYYLSREVRIKPAKWLLDFSISKSLFKGAEVSLYVNNFLDDPAIYRYMSTVSTTLESKRNPDLFYGIEFSMIFNSLF